MSRGRPKATVPTKSSKPVTIRLTPEDRDRLERITEETGYTVPALVRACVARALDFVGDRARAKPVR